MSAMDTIFVRKYETLVVRFEERRRDERHTQWQYLNILVVYS